MKREDAEKVIEVIDEMWQERRNTEAMSTETHNRELDRVEELKARVLGLVAAPEEPATAKEKKA